jgi:hypothetical protein
MTLDIKGVNSVLLIIIIVLVLYSLLRKELFTTSVAVPTTICSKKSNKNKAYHPSNSNNHEFNPENCMYVGENISSCKVDEVPLAANSGDEELKSAGKIGYLVGKSEANIEEMDTFDGSNMCNLCTSIPNETCLPTDMTCENINTETKLVGKLNELYGNDNDKQAKLEELANKYKRQITNFENENNSMSDKYKYLLGTCKSYCNMFNI